MITAEQIKAARALLNWKQSDLARESGISLPSINNIERAVGSPRVDTLVSIQNALQSAGIEFIGQQGVTRHKELFEITEHQGEDFVVRMNDDLFSCMYGADDVVMMVGLDDREYAIYSASEMLRYDDYHQKTKFTHKILVKEHETFFLSPVESFRWISPELLGKVPYMVYKDRLVMMMWEARRGVIIRSQSIADTFRKQFEFLWDMGQPVPAGSVNLLDDPAYRKKAEELRKQEQKEKKRLPVK
jgi:transcriptional regulator with XRE-family HTH domain